MDFLKEFHSLRDYYWLLKRLSICLDRNSVDSVISEAQLLRELHSHFDGLFFPPLERLEVTCPTLCPESDFSKFLFSWPSNMDLAELFKEDKYKDCKEEIQSLSDLIKKNKNCLISSGVLFKKIFTHSLEEKLKKNYQSHFESLGSEVDLREVLRYKMTHPNQRYLMLFADNMVSEYSLHEALFRVEALRASDSGDSEGPVPKSFSRFAMHTRNVERLESSAYRSDQSDLTHWGELLLEVKSSLIQGKILLLKHLDPILGSLYELFNQRFLMTDEVNKSCHIFFDNEKERVKVHPAFKCVLIRDSSELKEVKRQESNNEEQTSGLSKALLNRFEKHWLGFFSTCEWTPDIRQVLREVEREFADLEEILDEEVFGAKNVYFASHLVWKVLSEEIFKQDPDQTIEPSLAIGLKKRDSFFREIIKFYSLKMFSSHYRLLKEQNVKGEADLLKKMFLETHPFDSFEEFVQSLLSKKDPSSESKKKQDYSYFFQKKIPFEVIKGFELSCNHGIERKVVITESPNLEFEPEDKKMVLITSKTLHLKGEKYLSRKIRKFMTKSTKKKVFMIWVESEESQRFLDYTLSRIDQELMDIIKEKQSKFNKTICIIASTKSPKLAKVFPISWDVVVIENLKNSFYK